MLDEQPNVSNPRNKPKLSTVAHATTDEAAARLERRITELEDLARDLQQQNNELALDRALADRECRRLRREADALRKELAQVREEDPRSKTIRALLEHWKQATGHPRALTPLDGTRAGAVRRAMKWGFKPAKIQQAIDGAARYPYVVNAKRCQTGPKDCRYDDVETILKSEKQIDLLAALAEQPETASTPQRAGECVEPISLDAFLERLENVKRSGENWSASCPAHEDRHPSLRVAMGVKGIVAHCNGGCSPEQIADAIGVPLARWFQRDDTPPVARPKPVEPLAMERQVRQWRDQLQARPAVLARLRELRGWRPEILEALDIGFDGERLTLPVRNAEGELMNILRYLPVRRGDERKLLAMKGRPRDLFPAPETLPGDEFWLFEGEPDAVTGHELGLRATGLPGVNGWRVEWARRFSDRRVIVCLDCDEQGRKAAQRVLPSLLEHAAEVRVIDLDPSRTDGFDVADFVKVGGSAKDLLRLALAAGAVVRLGEAAA